MSLDLQLFNSYVNVNQDGNSKGYIEPCSTIFVTFCELTGKLIKKDVPGHTPDQVNKKISREGTQLHIF